MLVSPALDAEQCPFTLTRQTFYKMFKVLQISRHSKYMPQITRYMSTLGGLQFKISIFLPSGMWRCVVGRVFPTIQTASHPDDFSLQQHRFKNLKSRIQNLSVYVLNLQGALRMETVRIQISKKRGVIDDYFREYMKNLTRQLRC